MIHARDCERNPRQWTFLIVWPLPGTTPMHLKEKNRTPQGGFKFYFKSPNGDTIQVAGANSVSQLEAMVTANFKNLKMEVPANLSQLIEHQICVRQARPSDLCWNDGIGDDIHTKWAAPFLSGAARLAAKVLGPDSKIERVIRAVKSCPSCGGSRVYSAGKNNLGRAGTLNRLSKAK